MCVVYWYNVSGLLEYAVMGAPRMLSPAVLAQLDTNKYTNYEEHVFVCFKSNLLLNIQMYNMSSLNKYD